MATLDELVALAFDAVDLDASLLFEVGIQALVRVVVAGRVQVQLALGLGAAGDEAQQGRCADAGLVQHLVSSVMGFSNQADRLSVARIVRISFCVFLLMRRR